MRKLSCAVVRQKQDILIHGSQRRITNDQLEKKKANISIIRLKELTLIPRCLDYLKSAQYVRDWEMRPIL